MAARRNPQAQQQRQHRPPTQQAPADDIPISGPPQDGQTRQAPQTTLEALSAIVANDGITIVKPEVGALEALSRSEIAMQLDAAHRYPRSVAKFLREATGMATFSVEVAETCMYELPARSGGNGEAICGPSVRLAEMCSTAWGNLHVGARVIDVTAREVIAQAVAWDLERNVRITVETPRSILGKSGRYGDSMIHTTGLAALSISFRNAIFRVIPRAYVDAIYEASIACAKGTLQTLPARRDKAFAKYAELGVTADRILAKFGIRGVEDFTLDHLTSLQGIYNAIRSGELSIAEAFPVAAAAPAQPQRSKGSVLKDIVSEAKKSEPPPPKPAAEPPLTWAKIHAELARADAAWEGEYRLPLIMAWTPEQARAAWEWASAHNDKDLPDEDVPVRPVFTVLEQAERQPGED